MSPPRLMFASWHAYLDFSSGAALSTRDLFEDLTAHGWQCRVVCGPKLDYGDGREPTSVLRDCRIGYYREQCAPARGAAYELYHFTIGGVPISQYRPASPRAPVAHTPGSPVVPTQDEGIPFLDVVERACVQFRPDVVLTYGGPPIGPHLIRRVRRHGARVVFALHNMSYRDAALFQEVDAIRVPSEYARDVYRARLGLEVHAVEYPRNLTGALAGRTDGCHATFVNPVPGKGVAWFARIAAEMGKRRPEIPFLVVEGRGGAEWLQRVPIDLSGLRNLHLMRSTPRPKEFYALTRVVLVPSLLADTYPRVICEALANGYPVLASRRGGIPEALGGAGILFDIPDRYRGETLAVPAAEEVGEWVAAIERLWDDATFYDEQRQKALARAQVWEADRLRPEVEEFFRQVAIA